VVGQPSSVTSYVVLGSDAGPSKLKAIEKHKLRTLNEDEFLNLIATRRGPGGANGAGLDAKTKKKLEKAQEAIRQAANELELREKRVAIENANAPRRFVSLCILFNEVITAAIIGQRLWTRRLSSGQPDTHPKNLRRYAVTRDRLRNFGSGCMTGKSDSACFVHSFTATLWSQASEPEVRFQEAREKWNEYFSGCYDIWIAWHWEDD
jgi:hypothetical protein